MRHRQTSKIANRKAQHGANQEAVLAALKRRAMTCDQFEQVTQMAHQSAAAAFTRLSQRGVIIDTKRRKLTRRDCPAIVWELAK